MNSKYLNSPILQGFVYQGIFYPADASVQLGYWYNNAFYGPEWLEAGYDFTQTADAYPCSCSQTEYQPLPPGSVPGYSYLQCFYKTYYEAYQQLIERYPPVPPSPISTKKCSFCNQNHSDYMGVLAKTYCLHCLKRKYEANELYSGTAANPLLWSIDTVYKVYTALRTRLPTGDQIDPNQPIKLPLDSEICVGRNEEAAPGYPQYGHITGKNNLCVEDGCPRKEHKLCKLCAKLLLNCPICGEFIKFEEPRFDEYHPECDKNNHS